MPQQRWETAAGLPSHSLIYSQIHEKLIEIQELCAMNAHLYNTEDGPIASLLAKGWLGMSDLFKMMQHRIIELAKAKMS
jgi:hypothetical protein